MSKNLSSAQRAQERSEKLAPPTDRLARIVPRTTEREMTAGEMSPATGNR